MKARQQSFHDEGWQSRAGKETHAQKLDDVRVAEGDHQLAFPHELGGRFADLGDRDLGAVKEHFMDLFGRADGSRHGYLLHATVGSCANSESSEPYVGEQERL